MSSATHPEDRASLRRDKYKRAGGTVRVGDGIAELVGDEDGEERGRCCECGEPVGVPRWIASWARSFNRNHEGVEPVRSGEVVAHPDCYPHHRARQSRELVESLQRFDAVWPRLLQRGKDYTEGRISWRELVQEMRDLPEDFVSLNRHDLTEWRKRMQDAAPKHEEVDLGLK